MYELIQAGEKTYYINCPAKMGIYKINDTEVCLIDSGNDKDAGKKVLKIIESNGWTLKMIINTHSHADHIGGNKFLNAQPSNVQELTEAVMPNGLEMLRIDGHSFAMSAFKTDDDVWFLADCLTSEMIIEKYCYPAYVP